MAKKKAGRTKARADRETKSKTSAKPRKTSKHVDILRACSPAECNQLFEAGPAERLLTILDESYGADLANILLDLKKSTVKKFFEEFGGLRKRAMAEVATLYYYKEYLTNPLPLQIEIDSGETVPNYYALLGVPREATADELKMAHRFLVRAHSPESFAPPMRKAGTERLAEIQEAYDNLKSSQRREKADRLLPNISYLYPRRDQSWLAALQRVVG